MSKVFAPDLWHVYGQLNAGSTDEALVALRNFPRGSPIIESLERLARGMSAQAKGDLQVARESFEALWREGVPLATVLRECGSHFKRNRRYDDAYACHALLDELEPGAIDRLLNGLPAGTRRRYEVAVARRMLLAPRPGLYQLCDVKQSLVEHFGEDGAALLFSQWLRPDVAPRVLGRPLVSLQTYAKKHALAYEVIAPSRDVTLMPVPVFGREPRPSIAGRSRAFFFCVLPDIVVASKSNLLIARDCALMDYQHNEFVPGSIMLEVDPIVMAARGTTVTIVDCEEAARRAPLEQALSLTGIHSYNYGHWTFEFMFQLWACLDRPGFESVPVLIDEQMPAQHRQALEFFLGPDHPIVVLKPGESVRVRKLWTCSKPAFWPPWSDVNNDLVTEADRSDSKVLSSMLARLEPLRANDEGEASARLYLTRKSWQWRKLLNRPQVEQWFRAQGFEILDFADLSFADQIRLWRNARMVIVEDGSSIEGAIYGRPGLRIGVLTHASAAEHEWNNQMFRDLGHRMLLLPGNVVKENPAQPSSWESTIDLDVLPAFVQQLDEMP